MQTYKLCQKCFPKSFPYANFMFILPIFTQCNFKTLIEDLRFCITAKCTRHWYSSTGSNVNPGFYHVLLFCYHWLVASWEMVLP